MNGVSPSGPGDVLEYAERILENGQARQALGLVRGVLAHQPGSAQAHYLMGLALARLGEAAPAEQALRTAVRLDRGHEAGAVNLAELLFALKRDDEASAVLRTARKARPGSMRLAVRQAELLLGAGRGEQALAAIAGFAAGGMPDHLVLATQAQVLKVLGRDAEALAANRRAALLYPQNPVAHHNLAATLGDMAAFAEAEASADAAFGHGGDTAQTWLVYARALQGQGRLAEAEHAYGEAIRRRPDYAEAHRDRAQLVWMRTADSTAALGLLDEALRRHPAAALHEVRAGVQRDAGELPAAYATLQEGLRGDLQNPSLHIAAARVLGMQGDTARALQHARLALTAAPDSRRALYAVIGAYLGTGEVEQASKLCGVLLKPDPFDQLALAYQATAWRIMGEPRYHILHDYPGLVRAWPLDVPPGWGSLAAYLADLAAALDRTHAFQTHPLDQSVRHGSQAPHLLGSAEPAIRAFVQAVDGPIRQHLLALGGGRDPVRVRNRGLYRFKGMWSVRLRPGGFHVDHVHPQGWLSSACYIACPPEGPGREGWIKFGEPGLPTLPALEADHFIRPEPGMLVLFPSYMWHGTVSFTAEAPRLTAAFDLVPGPPAS